MSSLFLVSSGCLCDCTPDQKLADAVPSQRTQGEHEHKRCVLPTLLARRVFVFCSCFFKLETTKRTLRNKKFDTQKRKKLWFCRHFYDIILTHKVWFRWFALVPTGANNAKGFVCTSQQKDNNICKDAQKNVKCKETRWCSDVRPRVFQCWFFARCEPIYVCMLSQLFALPR